MASPPPAAPSNKRRYPRANLVVKARLFSGSDRSRSFEATLKSRDISVGGIFFESTFYLKLGQVLEVELELPPQGRVVRARGRVVRVETRDAKGLGAGGFAVRFDEYVGNSETILASYFMDQVLRRFVQDYGRRKGMRYDQEDMDRLVDVLASWELRRTSDEEIWTSKR